MESKRDPQCGMAAEIKALAHKMMYAHYTENDIPAVVSAFRPPFIWFGAGEEQYCTSYEKAVKTFQVFEGNIPKCNVTDEEYTVAQVGPELYLCTGRFWVETAPEVPIYAREHQRVTFLFRQDPDGLHCLHIHCSNPYGALAEDEVFPDKVGQYSYRYAQDKIRQLEEDMRQKQKQMEVVMKSINGGMKISVDDDMYTFAYVSPEAAALFGYTVDAFMQATGGTAVGTVYPPDLPAALAGCERCFRGGNPEYAVKYRVRCKDGSLKWILDSGKKSYDENGVCTINSLYLDITDSENKVQQIQKQQELLRSIYDTVPCGILRFVREADQYRLITVNQAILDIFGYADRAECLADWRDGVLGQVLLEDQQLIVRAYERLQKPGDVEEHEYRIHFHGDRIRWLSATTAVVGMDGDVPVLQRTISDITDRKILQEQIRREQEMYRLAMESSADRMYEYVFAEDTLTIYEPSNYEPAYGTNKQGIHTQIYRNFLAEGGEEDIAEPDDMRRLRNRVLNGGEIDCEVRMRDPNHAHGYLWHQVTGKCIWKDGVRERLVGTLRDINQVKQELSKNERALALNQMVLEAVRDVYLHIFCVDLLGDQYDVLRVQYSNRPLARHGQYSSTLVTYLLEQVEESDCDKLRVFLSVDTLRAQIREKDHVEIEVRQKAAAASSAQWVRIEGCLISARDGEPEQIVLTFLNISREKQRELEFLQEEIKAKAALQEAYETAKRANEAKSDFLSKMSHDIRTPINAIMGMTAIAEHQISDPQKVRECLSQVHKSSEHLLGLINEVLDMARIESRTMLLHNDEMSLRALMQTLRDMIGPEIAQHGHTLELSELRLMHEWVSGDQMRIQQIFLNLLTNAIKYTPDGGQISFTVEEKFSHANEGCYEFIVQDNGIGISPEFLKRIFEPFERAHDSRARQKQGTGLGMAIADNLVRMMGGEIKIQSRLNQGTRVRVTLYLPYTEEKQEASAESAAMQFHGERVLLVEDNALNREIARELLHMIGLECEEAVDGVQAVEKFAQSAPDYYQLILMDIQMPHMDGYQAARAIRSQHRLDAAAIPIIALTANAFADDAYQAAQAGMNEHVAKPIELQKLSRTLWKWLYERPI